MCALRTYIKLYIFRNIFLKIENIVITFSIFLKNIFKNRKSKAHINKILIKIMALYICYSNNNKLLKLKKKNLVSYVRRTIVPNE